MFTDVHPKPLVLSGEGFQKLLVTYSVLKGFTTAVGLGNFTQFYRTMLSETWLTA
jgi:hypothetical protein